jgi:hypothetical protein
MWRRSSGPLLRRGGLCLLIGALIGLLSASIIIMSDWAEGRASDVKFPLLMELTGAYTFLIPLPVILAAVRRFPITRGNWWHRVPLHVGFSVVVGVSHTLLMWGSRTLAYWALETGPRPHRAAAGDAGPVDPSNAAPGPGPRARHRQDHRAQLRRGAAGRAGVALPSAAPADPAGVDIDASLRCPERPPGGPRSTRRLTMPQAARSRAGRFPHIT